MNRVAGLTLAAAILAFAPLAQAQDQTRTFEVAGSAPQVCNIDRPNLGDRPPVNVQALDGSNLRIVSLVDPTTLATAATSVQLSMAAVCTVPHRLTVESRSNGLWRSQASGVGGAPGFTSAVPYTLEIEWGDARERMNADALSRGRNQASTFIESATVGDLTLLLTIEPGASNQLANAPLLAGAYADTLTVTLEPQ